MGRFEPAHKEIADRLLARDTLFPQNLNSLIHDCLVCTRSPEPKSRCRCKGFDFDGERSELVQDIRLGIRLFPRRHTLHERSKFILDFVQTPGGPLRDWQRKHRECTIDLDIDEPLACPAEPLRPRIAKCDHGEPSEAPAVNSEIACDNRVSIENHTAGPASVIEESANFSREQFKRGVPTLPFQDFTLNRGCDHSRSSGDPRFWQHFRQVVRKRFVGPGGPVKRI